MKGAELIIRVGQGERREEMIVSLYDTEACDVAEKKVNKLEFQES